MFISKITSSNYRPYNRIPRLNNESVYRKKYTDKKRGCLPDFLYVVKLLYVIDRRNSLSYFSTNLLIAPIFLVSRRKQAAIRRAVVKTRDCSKNVDTIYVMYNGEIAEVGDYQDLELHKWIYANMYALQSSWYK